MRFEGQYYHDVAKVIGNLSKAGRLIGTTDGFAYYHVEETGELLRITGTAKQRDLVRPFLTLLHDEYGIISSQPIGPALLDTLDIMAMRPPLFDMKSITKLDRPTRTMYLAYGQSFGHQSHADGHSLGAARHGRRVLRGEQNVCSMGVCRRIRWSR